jgi:hypothetical protein
MNEKIYYAVAMILCLAIGIITGIIIAPQETIVYQNENVNLEEMKILKNIGTDCYWATQYLDDPEGTIKHFQGRDYKDQYIYDCIKQSHNNWELLERS